MELIRQKLIVETEHFLNFKNSNEIRYPWDVGPFIIKNKVALPMIESLLKEMGFFTKAAINYDCHHVISIRRQALKRNPFENFEVVGLAQAANWSDYPYETQKDIDMQEGSTSSIK